MKSLASITMEQCGDVDNLQCPRCCAVYLHHGRVTLFDRREDAAMVVCTQVDGAQVQMAMQAADAANPSERRHGLVIDFWCECCGGGFELCVAQMKGTTSLYWRWEAAS